MAPAGAPPADVAAVPAEATVAPATRPADGAAGAPAHAGDAGGSTASAEPPARAAPRPTPAAVVFDPFDTQLRLEPVAGGFDEPVHAASDGTGRGRLYVVEKAGRIRRLDLARGTVADAPFADLTDRVNSAASERGLLSVAFHPRFVDNGRLFVNYTRRDGDTVIAELAADADRDRADAGSERRLLVIDQPAANHNGGQNAFGPDGYLYVGMGDGGGSGADNAQDPSNLLGKILRLDVDAVAAPADGADAPTGYAVPPDNPFVAGPFAPEVWAYGLRNPWRLAFDGATGDLFIADVGASALEEVNVQPAASRGGEDYGWPLLEGRRCRDGDDCDPDGRTVRPAAEYGHDDGNCAVSGGQVYRGRRSRALQGVYLYGDYCSGRIWGLWRARGGWRDAVLLDTDLAISAFGRDDDGEVYVLDMAGGDVLRIAADDG